ncbi:hypothetical protein BH09ACT5_BH09ACT5_07540 [soil metagenome]
MSFDTGDTVVGQVPHVPPAPLDPNADTVVRGAEPRQPELRRTEAHTRAPRPASTAPVYSFRIGALKDPIMLDRPARIGRRPSSPRIVMGAPPRLVRVVSPQREVSATHLELRQIGVTVVVTDLRSTNGTVVLLPGSPPRKLLQGESVVVSPGTLVDIGDENILQILPLDRRPS